jgi:hypothetical protein
VNITKLKFSKWWLAVLWKFTDKEISEIKINSVPNNTKDLCKNTKTIIRLRLGDYRGIFTSTSSRRIFPDNHLAFGELIIVKYSVTSTKRLAAILKIFVLLYSSAGEYNSLIRQISSNIEAVRHPFLGRRRVEEGRRRAGFLGRRKGGGGAEEWGGGGVRWWSVVE